MPRNPFPQRDRHIDYIEFAVADMARTKAFYAAAFGWTFTDYGPDYCEFTDGRMKGGFERSDQVTPGGPLIVLYGADLAEVQASVEAAGGKIARAVFAFPGGHRFEFTDPDGHLLAVWNAD